MAGARKRRAGGECVGKARWKLGHILMSGDAETGRGLGLPR